MSNNQQIVRLPIPQYISGLDLSVASTTVIAMAPGQARDSLDIMDLAVGYPNYIGTIRPLPTYLNCPQPIFINTAVVGANGLDAGTLAASSNYVVYLIGDSSNFKVSAGLISLSSNQYPLLPIGYDSYRVIGYATTDGSTHFTAATVFNVKNAKAFFLQPYVSVLAGGNATSFTAIDMSTPIPTTTAPYVTAYLNILFTPANIGDVVQFRPTGSSATAGLATIVGVAAGISQTACLSIVAGVGSSKPEIDYKVSVSGDAVSVLVEGYSYTTT